MIVPQNPTYAYVGAFVDELARAGVRDVVICPGSRSTPLTLTFAAEARIRKWVLVDERSAAFFALGIAKRSGVSVALVCTSGTAAANFYPAVCEAKASRIPLIVMTADRPPELQEVGAPQTMGQKYLYGEHVKWFTEMPLPEATGTLLRYARFTANRAVATAESTPFGPVHLNFPLREPLANIENTNLLLPDISKRVGVGWQGKSTEYTQVSMEPRRTSLDLTYSGSTLTSFEKGLIIVGPMDPEFDDVIYGKHRILELAVQLGWVVLLDPLSRMRHTLNAHFRVNFLPPTDELHSYIVENYDAILRDKNFFETYKPDFVLRIGGVPTSKILLQFLENAENCRICLIDEGLSWADPMLRLDEVIPTQVDTAIDAFLYDIHAFEIPPRSASAWLIAWQRAASLTRNVMEYEISGFRDLFEGRVFSELAQILPKEASLVVGNSMPIRDCDTFFPLPNKAIEIYGNRGVNGIDGQISTALGLTVPAPKIQSWKRPRNNKNQPTVLVVGDLTFYHDLNGLLAAKKYGLNLTIVVINNDGGGIFSFLPQAEHHPDHFEDYFGTPTGLDFRLVTEMYGGTFTRIENWDDFRAAVTTGITEGGLHVVEVPTNRERNVEMHRHLWKKVSEALTTANESDDSERK